MTSSLSPDLTISCFFLKWMPHAKYNQYLESMCSVFYCSPPLFIILWYDWCAFLFLVQSSCLLPTLHISACLLRMRCRPAQLACQHCPFWPLLWVTGHGHLPHHRYFPGGNFQSGLFVWWYISLILSMHHTSCSYFWCAFHKEVNSYS